MRVPVRAGLGRTWNPVPLHPGGGARSGRVEGPGGGGNGFPGRGPAAGPHGGGGGTAPASPGGCIDIERKLQA